MRPKKLRLSQGALIHTGSQFTFADAPKSVNIVFSGSKWTFIAYASCDMLKIPSVKIKTSLTEVLMLAKNKNPGIIGVKGRGEL
jgi:hypothetical protein